MTVKELRKSLERFPDDAVVVLYNGSDESDTAVSELFMTTIKDYDCYCRGTSCIEFMRGYLADDVDVLVISDN